jgi:Flp pilus assembly protein TadD
MDKHTQKCLYQQAKTLYVMKEYENALALTDALLLKSPREMKLLCLKAKCLRRQGRNEEAEKLLGQLLTTELEKEEHAPCEEMGPEGDVPLEEERSKTGSGAR